MIFSRANKEDEQPRRRAVTDEERPSSLKGGDTFRRGQTLSSFRRLQDDQTSHRHRAHHLTAKRSKVGGIFLLVLGVIAVLTLLLLQFTARTSFTASNTNISQPIKPSTYQSSIDEYYALHPVERLRFMMNDAALTEYVSQGHPEVSRVALSGSTEITEAQFAFSFREPVAGWQINNRQYYVDRDGVVFEKNYFTAPSVQIVDESGVSPEQGSAVASARLLSFVGKIVSEAGERGYDVTSVSLPAATTRQLQIRLKDIQPYIRFTIEREAGEQVVDMIKSVEYLAARQQAAEYIDVRVEGKAVYK